MASVYVYKGGNAAFNTTQILNNVGVTLAGVMPSAWYAQCGCVSAAPLTAEDKSALDQFMSDQGWVYLRQDDTFDGGPVVHTLDGWLNVGLAAGLLDVPCARYGIAALLATQRPRPGSAVGLYARVTAPLAAGTLTVTARIAGANTALAVTLDAATPTKAARAALGIYPYALADALALVVSTDGLFAAPGAILEAYLDVIE